MKRSGLIVFIGLVILLLTNCGKTDYHSDVNTLAVVESRTVSKVEFFRRFSDFRNRTDIPDNGMTRRQVLQALVDEKVLIAEAIRREFDCDADGKKERERVEIQELLNLCNREFVAKKVTISEDELKHLFINLNTKIKARHLYSPTLAGAESLYTRIQKGETFEKLAYEVFHDPVLQESGGSLGYFTVDEMDAAFENTAFALKVGAVSRPVRTSDGYSIIRVDDRVLVNPLLTENEFAKHRAKLENYWLPRKITAATAQFVDSMRQELHVVFEEETVAKIFNALKDNPDVKNSPETIIALPGLDEILDKIVVSSSLGNWTVKTLQEKARFTTEQQRGWIRSTENLKDYTAGLVVRSYILELGQKAGLDRSDDYKKNVSGAYDQYLLDRMEKVITEEMRIPDDSLNYYYKADPQAFANPAKIGLQEIVLTDEKTAQQVKRELQDGCSFADVAQKYSINRRSAVNGGDLGYLTPQDLGKWWPTAAEIEVNSWRGPLRMDSLFVFLRCTDKIPPKLRSFDEARSDIEAMLRSYWFDRNRENRLAEFRLHFKITAYPEKITTSKNN